MPDTMYIGVSIHFCDRCWYMLDVFTTFFSLTYIGAFDSGEVESRYRFPGNSYLSIPCCTRVYYIPGNAVVRAILVVLL